MVEDELNYASQLTARTDMTLHSALVSWLPGLNVKPFCLQVEGYTLGFCQGPELFYRIFTKTASIKANFFENKKSRFKTDITAVQKICPSPFSHFIGIQKYFD